MDDGAAFLGIFRAEAAERLDAIVQALISVEDGSAEEDVVGVLFRETHTIKGGASLVGLDDVHRLAHAMEAVLSDLRAARSPVNAAAAATLLRAADAMRGQLDGTNVPVDHLLADLAAARADGAARQGLVLSSGNNGAAPAPRGSTVRVASAKVDRLVELVGESALHQQRLDEILAEELSAGASHELTAELDSGRRLLDQLKRVSLDMRMLPVSSILGPLRRAVRDLAHSAGKEIHLTVSGEETELDRELLDRLSESLVHVIRNAIGHGIESPAEREEAGKARRGLIEILAEPRNGLVEISVRDDGRGVPAPVVAEARREQSSLADVLTRAGFSTAAEVTELSGHGVGLDAVRRSMQSVGGHLAVASEPGHGTEVRLSMPLTLALLDVLLFECGRDVYGVPLANVVAAAVPGESHVDTDGEEIRPVGLAEVIGARAAALRADAPAVIVRAGEERAAVTCDRLLGEDEIVLKSLRPLLGGLRSYLGAAILGDGRIALILDPGSLIEQARRHAYPSSP
jgi:two-component system, chemotaxis family, sensor kinase CheA